MAWKTKIYLSLILPIVVFGLLLIAKFHHTNEEWIYPTSKSQENISTEEKIKRLPQVLIIGAKKCGTCENQIRNRKIHY